MNRQFDCDSVSVFDVVSRRISSDERSTREFVKQGMRLDAAWINSLLARMRSAHTRSYRVTIERGEPYEQAVDGVLKRHSRSTGSDRTDWQIHQPAAVRLNLQQTTACCKPCTLCEFNTFCSREAITITCKRQLRRLGGLLSCGCGSLGGSTRY